MAELKMKEKGIISAKKKKKKGETTPPTTPWNSNKGSKEKAGNHSMISTRTGCQQKRLILTVRRNKKSR